MTDQFNYELDDADMLAAIDRAIAALERPRELMDEIGAAIESAANLRFQTKTDPAGNAWPALSPATIDIYESEWFIKQNPAFAGGIPGTLLERTGQLLASLAHNAGDDFAEIGTSRASKGGRWQIGLLHETGTRNMPRRGFLVADADTSALGADDEAEVLGIVSTYLGSAFG